MLQAVLNILSKHLAQQLRKSAAINLICIISVGYLKLFKYATGLIKAYIYEDKRRDFAVKHEISVQRSIDFMY